MRGAADLLASRVLEPGSSGQLVGAFQEKPSSPCKKDAFDPPLSFLESTATRYPTGSCHIQHPEKDAFCTQTPPRA